MEPYAEVVQQLVDQQVEMVAIFQRLRDDHGFSGSYSSVRRYVHRLRPAEPRVVVRVQMAPREEAQVDFGPVGRLCDPATERLRPAYAFVATLNYSCHQEAELVFDQPVSPGATAARALPTWRCRSWPTSWASAPPRSRSVKAAAGAGACTRISSGPSSRRWTNLPGGRSTAARSRPGSEPGGN